MTFSTAANILIALIENRNEDAEDIARESGTAICSSSLSPVQNRLQNLINRRAMQDTIVTLKQMQKDPLVREDPDQLITDTINTLSAFVQGDSEL